METSPVSSSVGAIQQAFKTHTERADRLAKSAAADVPDPVRHDQFIKDMAELPTDEHKVGVQVAALKTQDKMTGALLDLLA